VIRVLIVDDSQVTRDLLTFILSSDPAIQVTGTAKDGKEAIQAVRDLKPDIVLMDLIMPVMGGLEATRSIMETTPTPIVIVSAVWSASEAKKSFQAMEAGALAALPKPVGISHPHYANLTKELIQTVKLMSEVKVFRKRPQAEKTAVLPADVIFKQNAAMKKNLKVVVIGASTGGPQAVKTVLSGLPKDFPAPVLIVQHIAAGFIQHFADWLAATTGLPVNLAAPGEYPLPGHAYLAPDAYQMGLSADGRIVLLPGSPADTLCPSVAFLFRSIAEVCPQNAVAVLLTGMGKDGARELKLLRDKGAVTIAQDRESSVIYGMPGEAVALAAASFVLPPEKIAEMLTGLVQAEKQQSMTRSL